MRQLFAIVRFGALPDGRPNRLGIDYSSLGTGADVDSPSGATTLSGWAASSFRCLRRSRLASALAFLSISRRRFSKVFWSLPMSSSPGEVVHSVSVCELRSMYWMASGVDAQSGRDAL